MELKEREPAKVLLENQPFSVENLRVQRGTLRQCSVVSVMTNHNP